MSNQPRCLAVVFQRHDGSDCRKSGTKIFHEFQDVNRSCFWNPALIESICSLEYVGFVRPGTLIVSSSDHHLECLCGAWSRRVLKAPSGFTIKSLGDMNGIEMAEIPQTHFVPLPEAICVAISAVNQLGRPASLEDIKCMLQKQYMDMSMPKPEVLYATLKTMIAEGKVYGSNDAYVLTSPLALNFLPAYGGSRAPLNPYNMVTAPIIPPNTVNIDGYPTAGLWQPNNGRDKVQEVCSRECQTGASVVNAVPPYKPKCDKAASCTNVEGSKLVPNCEQKGKIKPLAGGSETVKSPTEENGGSKGSILSRIFRRRSKSKNRESHVKSPTEPQCSENCPIFLKAKQVQGSDVPIEPLQTKHATFAAQFPPTEWLHDPRFLKAGNVQQQQHYIPFFRAKRSDPQPQMEGGGKAPERGALWLDFDGASVNPRRRYHPDFRSYRNHNVILTCPENLHQRGLKDPASGRVRNRQRLSKYLSSSSECLVPITAPFIPGKEEKRKDFGSKHPGGRERHHPGRSSRDHRGSKLVAGLVDLDKLPVSERVLQQFEPPGFGVSEAEGISAREPRGRVVRHFLGDRRGLVSWTDQDEDNAQDKLSDVNGLTASPTPPRDDQIDLNKAVVQPLIQSQEPVEHRGARDSAVSVSPNTDRTDSAATDNKYSSWSGSEGKQADLEEKEKGEKILDHTYENLKVVCTPQQFRLDQDSVLLGDGNNTLDSTQFEQITDATLDEAEFLDEYGKKDERVKPAAGDCMMVQKSAVTAVLMDAQKMRVTQQYVSAL